MDFKNRCKKMIQKELVLPNTQVTVDDVLKDLDKIHSILVYSDDEYVGNIWYDSCDKPASWYILRGLDFATRDCYESLIDLLQCIRIYKLSIRVNYYD